MMQVWEIRNAIAELYRPDDWRDSKWQHVFLQADDLIQSALTAAYKRGQENMRERAAVLSDAELTYFGTAIRALPIEEG